MKGVMSNVAGVAAAGAVLAAGLFIGAPDVEASGPGSPHRLSAPPAVGAGAAEIDLGDGLEIWGRPSQQSAFWTPDDPKLVAQTYLDAWQEAGLRAMTHTIDKVTSVSALEESTGLLRTVTVIDGGERDHLVLPGITDVRALPDPTPAGAPVPVPATAAGFIAHTADDRQAVSYSASYLVALQPQQVVRFYERELNPAGYEPTPRSVSLKAASTEWRRGSENVSVVATPLGKSGDEAATSFVVVTHVRTLNDGEVE